MDLEVLIRRLDALEDKVDTLEKENAFLKDRLAKYENSKNSRNSSLPPSKDENALKRIKVSVNLRAENPEAKKDG